MIGLNEEYCDGWRIVRIAGGFTYENEDGRRLQMTFGPKSCPFVNGCAKVQLPNGKFSFIDSDGNLFKHNFVSARAFNKCGYALVEVEDDPYVVTVGEKQKRKTTSYAFVGKDGKILPYKFAGATDYFRGGLAKVMFKNGRYGYLRDDGRLISRSFRHGGEVFSGISKTYLNNGEVYLTMGDDPVIGPLVERLLELECGPDHKRQRKLLSDYFQCNQEVFEWEEQAVALLGKFEKHIRETIVVPFTYARVGGVDGFDVYYVDYHGNIWCRGLRSNTFSCVERANEEHSRFSDL